MRGPGRILLPIAGMMAGDVAHQFQSLEFQGSHVTGGLVDLGGQVAVGEGEDRWLVLDSDLRGRHARKKADTEGFKDLHDDFGCFAAGQTTKTMVCPTADRCCYTFSGTTYGAR